MAKRRELPAEIEAAIRKAEIDVDRSLDGGNNVRRNHLSSEIPTILRKQHGAGITCHHPLNSGKCVSDGRRHVGEMMRGRDPRRMMMMILSYLIFSYDNYRAVLFR